MSFFTAFELSAAGATVGACVDALEPLGATAGEARRTTTKTLDLATEGEHLPNLATEGEHLPNLAGDRDGGRATCRGIPVLDD